MKNEKNDFHSVSIFDGITYEKEKPRETEVKSDGLISMNLISYLFYHF